MNGIGFAMSGERSLLKASNPNRALTQHLCEAFDASIVSNDSSQRQCVAYTQTITKCPSKTSKAKLKLRLADRLAANEGNN